MGLTLQQMRDKVRKPLGVDEDDLPNTDVDLLLNTSWWEVADIFEFREKETKRSYNTVIGTNSYPVATDIEGLQQVVITDPTSNQHTTLDPMSLLVYESDFVDDTNAQGKPRNYVRRGSEVILYPTPDKVYPIIEYYWKTLTDLASGGPAIPQAWHEIIVYGAVYRGFADFGDYNRSRAAKQMQMELISVKDTPEAQEKFDRPYASLRALRPRYP